MVEKYTSALMTYDGRVVPFHNKDAAMCLINDSNVAYGYFGKEEISEDQIKSKLEAEASTTL